MRFILIILVPIILFSGCKSLKNQEVPNDSTNDKTAWISHPASVQCEEAYYPTMASAKSFLEENEIKVQDIKKKNLMVCSACGCPSSTHFIAKINFNNIEKAKSLGWKLFNESNL